MNSPYRPAFPRPTLCLVTDRTLTGGEDGLVRAVEAAVAGGVNMVQLREKDLPHDALVDLARRLREAISGRALLMVNGDAEAAAEVGADGVQLGEDAMPVAEARQIIGLSRLVGRSVHAAEGAAIAERDGADFVIAGTVFQSRSHSGGPASGLALIRDCAAAVRIPVIAIGGITTTNAPDVVRAGAYGVAVISAILGDRDPEAAARRLASAIMGAASGRTTP